jgi:hypothetical protein
MKTWIILIVALIGLNCSISNAGLFSDDPIKIQAKPVSKLLSKDELEFTLLDDFLVWHPELTLELQYSTGTQKLSATQTGWHKDAKTDFKVVFKLPKNLEGLQKYRLTGKFEGIYKFDKKGEKVRIGGYKIDSTWSVK